MQVRRDWKEVFKVMKGKDLHPILLYPAKLSFRMEGQIKCFPDKQTTRPGTESQKWRSYGRLSAVEWGVGGRQRGKRYR